MLPKDKTTPLELVPIGNTSAYGLHEVGNVEVCEPCPGCGSLRTNVQLFPNSDGIGRRVVASWCPECDGVDGQARMPPVPDHPDILGNPDARDLDWKHLTGERAAFMLGFDAGAAAYSHDVVGESAVGDHPWAAALRRAEHNVRRTTAARAHGYHDSDDLVERVAAVAACGGKPDEVFIPPSNSGVAEAIGLLDRVTSKVGEHVVKMDAEMLTVDDGEIGVTLRAGPESVTIVADFIDADDWRTGKPPRPVMVPRSLVGKVALWMLRALGQTEIQALRDSLMERTCLGCDHVLESADDVDSITDTCAHCRPSVTTP